MRELEHSEGRPQVIEDAPDHFKLQNNRENNKTSSALPSQKCVFSLQLSPEPFMKIMLLAGLILVVLGIASLLVPIPHTEKHGIKAGDVNIGVETTQSERVSPIISVVLIAGGIALTVGGARTRSSTK